jgi:hypothetical protein
MGEFAEQHADLVVETSGRYWLTGTNSAPHEHW